MAEANGRVAHPAMEWTAVTGSYELSWGGMQPGLMGSGSRARDAPQARGTGALRCPAGVHDDARAMLVRCLGRVRRPDRGELGRHPPATGGQASSHDRRSRGRSTRCPTRRSATRSPGPRPAVSIGAWPSTIGARACGGRMIVPGAWRPTSTCSRPISERPRPASIDCRRQPHRGHAGHRRSVDHVRRRHREPTAGGRPGPRIGGGGDGAVWGTVPVPRPPRVVPAFRCSCGWGLSPGWREGDGDSPLVGQSPLFGRG